MNSFLDSHIDMKNASPLSLAFVGDSVYELFVRELLISRGIYSLKKLNAAKVDFVRCEFQAKAAGLLSEIFTQEEEAVYLRGRNAHVGHVPKNSSSADYHAATALESLFGYLYLSGQLDRLKEIFNIISAIE